MSTPTRTRLTFVALLGAAIARSNAAEPVAPPFQNLRFDDPAATRQAAAWQRSGILGDGSEIALGGQVRVRGEWWENFNFKPDNDDEFLLSRARLHADLRVTPVLRFYVEGRGAWANDRDLPTPDGSGKRPIDEDVLDLLNAFGDVGHSFADDTALTLRLGRQELSYGKERVIGVGDWTNTRRTFDGAKVIATAGDWRIDAFLARLVLVQRYEFNDGDSGQDLGGVYATRKLAGLGGLIDLYTLRREKEAAGKAAADDRNTFGARLGGVCGDSGVDYEVEGAWQNGDSGETDISAWMLASQIGFKVPDCPYGTRFFAGFDYATGDDDAADGDAHRYDQLYPTGHPFLGTLDVIGRQNVQDLSVGVEGKPAAKWRSSIVAHWFERAENNDGVFDAGGAQVIAGDASAAGEIGQELDVNVSWLVDAHVTLAAGYGHFFAGDVVSDSGGDDIDSAYVSGQYTF